MRVAAIQMTSTPAQADNMDHIHQCIQDAARKGADLVALPENCTLLTERRKDQLAHAQTLRGLTVQIFQEWAAEYDLWILVGSLPIKATKDKIRNTSILVNSDGDLVASYNKIHLFDCDVKGSRSYQESKAVVAGNKVVRAKSPWGTLGLSICYDLRFPELYRKLKADIIFIPAAFIVETGKAHWDVLTRARAIENQAYVVAPAQVGHHYEGRETYGHTRIIDPWGKILSEQLEGPGMIWADLDLKNLAQIRTDLPALSHQKLK